MTDRSVVQAVQEIAFETTPGTPVTPTTLLQALTLDLAPNAEFDTYGARGQEYDAGVALRYEDTRGGIGGFPTYTELLHVLRNRLGNPTKATPGGATNTRRYTWDRTGVAWPAIKPWTVRSGAPGLSAEEVAHFLINGLTMGFNKTGAQEIGGSGLGKAWNTGASLTGTSVGVALVPILAGDVNVYVDATSGALGTTKYTRDFVATVDFGEYLDTVPVLDRATGASFATTSFVKPDPTVTLQVGNDSVGRGLFTQMRAGSSRFIRIEAQSPTEIEATFPYKLTMDFAGQIQSAPSVGDVNNLSTLEWVFRIVRDAGWAKAFRIVLDTSIDMTIS